MTSNFCPDCGAQRQGGMRFCATCGLDYDSVTSSNPVGARGPASAPPRPAPMQPHSPQQSQAVRTMRTGAWIVTLIYLAGFVPLWFVGEGDVETKVIVTVLLGIVGTAFVLVVVRVLLALGLLGWFLFRGPRR